MFIRLQLEEASLLILNRRILLRVLLNCLILAFAIQPNAAQVPDSGTPAQHYLKQQQTAEQLFQSGKFAEYASHLHAMTEEYPNKSSLLPPLAAVYVQLGQDDKANEALQRFAKMGGTLAFRDPNLKQFRDAGKLKSLDQIESNGKPKSSGARLFALADPNLLTEDIAYDPKTSHIFLSSVHERKILNCTAKGGCDVFAANSTQLPLLGILALEVDPARRTLWATSVGMKMASGLQDADDGRSALLKFDVSTGKLLGRYEPSGEGKHALGDMTLGADGTAYVSDGQSGDLFVLRPGANKLQELVPHGTFVSPQTPALSRDGTLLYVPDYTRGIAVVDLGNQTVGWVTSSVPAALDCIDGLYAVADDQFIAVQNGTQPERIVSFHLRSPREIDGFKVLEANWKGLGDPTHGVVVNNSFYFIVNSGWDRIDDNGKFSAGEPAQVWKLELSKL